MNAPDDTTRPAPPVDAVRSTITAPPPASADSGTQVQSEAPTHLFSTSGLPAVPGFALLAEVGRGGMGVVYRARDASLRRDVAVKILLNHYPADGEAARRFVEESQITSQLQHPGIPPVHQVGMLVDGRPFLVMKLIKGRTLDKLLKERPTSVAERGRFVAAFEQVCQAVGYAHAHNVIHRDLKPQNIMVGAFGEVQVMDWGLSKSLTDAPPVEVATIADEVPRTAIGSLRDLDSATRAGSVMGTPAFMPPEQAGGEVEKIDARSDVFSLGAVLCVILTGQPPYIGDSIEAVQLNAIRGQLADALSRLDACGAEPELVALCKRCLSVELADRPKDANELAAAVAGFRSAAEERARQAELDRVRVEGEQAKAATEMREQRKRRKVQLALAVSVALLVAAGGAFAWWQDRQASERKLADERTEAQWLRIEGDHKAAEARAAAERDFKAQQVRQGVKAGLALATDLRKQYKFKAADATLAQAAELTKGAPELLPEVEQARSDLAFVVKLDDIRYRKWAWIGKGGEKGDFNTKIAAPEYRKAFADRGLDPTALEPAEVAKRIVLSGAKAEIVAALDDWALYEPDVAVRARLLEVARKADAGPWTDRLRDPAVRHDWAAVEKLAAEADPAQTPAAALTVLSNLMVHNGVDPVGLLAGARAKHPTDFELAFILGQWYSVNSKDGREIGPYEAARALRPENPSVWNNLGSALFGKGDIDGAIAAYKKAIELDAKCAHPHYNLGGALYGQGDKDGAIAAYKEAIKLDPGFAHAHHNLGVALHDKGDIAGAIAAYKEAIKLDAQYASAYSGLGGALRDKGDVDGAIAAYKKAIELDPKHSDAYANLGVALRDKGDVDRAIMAHKEAIKLNSKLAPAHLNLGVALRDKGDVDGAIAAYKEAIKLDPKLAKAHHNLGNALHDKGDVDGAIAAHKEAIKLDPKLAQAHLSLGVGLRDKGDIAGAVAAFKEAVALDSGDAVAHTNLGALYAIQKKYPEAIACARAAIKANPKYSNAHVVLWGALSQTGDLLGARAALTEAVRLDKRWAKLLVELPPIPLAPPPREVRR